MSQYPPQPPQPPYQPQPPYPPYGQGQAPFAYASPVRLARPGIVTALAVIGCIVGGLFTLCTPCGFAQFFIDTGQANAAMDILKNNKAAWAWTLGSMTLNWVAGALLLTGSIGAFSLKGWARTCMLIGAAVILVIQAIGLVLQFTAFKDLHEAQMADIDPQAKNMMKIIMPVMWALIGLIAFYLLSVLYFLTRPHIKAVFQRQGALPPAGGYPPAA